MSRPTALLAGLALALAGGGVTACGADDEDKEPAKGAATDKSRSATTATTAAPASPECRKVAKPRAKGEQRLPAPTLKLDADKTYRAAMDTSCGKFTITLDVKQSPKTSASFVYLARRGFFDDLTFHRIVSGFVIQGGDPLGNGQGGPGYSVVEPPPGDVRYTRGTVAMAKTEIEDPGTSGSQFYVVTGEDAQLPADYALLGKVTEGEDVVRTIGLVRTDQTNPDPNLRDRPLDPVVIRKVTISESK